MDGPEFTIIEVHGIENRLQLAFAAVTEGIADPVCTQLTDMATEACPRTDPTCEIERIYGLVQSLATYRQDPGALDLYKTLRWLIKTRTGDCSSFTIALLTFLALRGYVCGASTIWQSEGDWDHIYGLVGIHGRDNSVLRLPVDATKPLGIPGFEQPATKWHDRLDWWYNAIEWMAWYQNGADVKAMPRVVPVGRSIVRRL